MNEDRAKQIWDRLDLHERWIIQIAEQTGVALDPKPEPNENQQ